MSLLDEAIKNERNPKVDSVTVEQIELGIAWAEGAVSTGAVGRALGAKPSSVFPLVARFLQAAVREGYLKKTRKNPEGNNATPAA
jgi:hypothetical protein